MNQRIVLALTLFALSMTDIGTATAIVASMTPR